MPNPTTQEQVINANFKSVHELGQPRNTIELYKTKPSKFHNCDKDHENQLFEDELRGLPLPLKYVGALDGEKGNSSRAAISANCAPNHIIAISSSSDANKLRQLAWDDPDLKQIRIVSNKVERVIQILNQFQPCFSPLYLDYCCTWEGNVSGNYWERCSPQNDIEKIFRKQLLLTESVLIITFSRQMFFELNALEIDANECINYVLECAEDSAYHCSYYWVHPFRTNKLHMVMIAFRFSTDFPLIPQRVCRERLNNGTCCPYIPTARGCQNHPFFPPPPQCIGIMKSGHRCPYYADPVTQRCGHHPIKPIKPPPVICDAIVKSTRRNCTCKAKPGSTRCGRHSLR